MSEKPQSHPESKPEITSYEQKTYDNGVNHLYGVDEGGKKHHLSYKDVAKQHGYELPEEGDTDNPYLYKLQNGGEVGLRSASQPSLADGATENIEAVPSQSSSNTYLDMLRSGGRNGQDKQRKAEAKQEYETLAKKAALGVSKTEGIASKRLAREHYLAWKEDVDAMRAERVDHDKKAWQARMGIIDESEVPTKEKPVYSVKQDKAAEQRQTELAHLLRAADKAHLASATEQQAAQAVTIKEANQTAVDKEPTAEEKTAADAAEADKAFFSSDERKAALGRMENLRALREIKLEEKALEAEQQAIEAQIAEEQGKTLRGRIRRLKDAIRDTTNLAAGKAFLAVGNRLRNADQYQEHINRRRGAIAIGIGAVAVAAIGYAVYKGIDTPDVLNEGSDVYDFANPGDYMGEEASRLPGSSHALPDPSDSLSSGEGSWGESPGFDSGLDGETGTELDGSNYGEQTGNEPSPEVASDGPALQTEVLNVDQGDGFISTIRDQYGLDAHEAEQAYEAIKQHLIGAEGTYTYGTDIRIADAGTFELPSTAQSALEEYLKSIGKL